MHYARFRRNGDPLVVLPVGRPFPRKETVGYSAAHYRIRKDRGRAPEHGCVLCGAQAHDWALRPGVATLVGVNNGSAARYSLDPNDYDPMCRECHSQHDWSLRDAA